MIVSSLVAGIMTASTPGSGIPEQFRGQWENEINQCLPAMTGRPIIISEHRVRINHSVGNVAVLERAGAREIRVAGELMSDGGPHLIDLLLQLSANQDELTISREGMTITLQRCPIYEEKSK